MIVGVYNFAFEKLQPTSELHFAECPSELGTGEYDFLLHLKCIYLPAYKINMKTIYFWQQQ